MTRLIRLIALAALVFSMNSCGLPGALIRSTGRLAQAAGGLLGPAAAAAAL